MKRLFIAVAAALLIASCSSQSGDRDKRLIKRVVRELTPTTDGSFIVSPDKQIKRVDNMYEVGDTIKLVNQYYLITK